MSKKIAFLCLAAFQLAGCETPRPIPIALHSGPESSKVRFDVQLDGGWIDLYPQEDCNGGVPVAQHRMQTLVEITKGTPPPRADMLNPPAPNARYVSEYAFRPKQVLNFSVHGGRNCIGGASFQLEPGQQYEIQLNGSLREGCAVSISTLSQKAGAVERARKRNIQELVCTK